MGQIITSEPQAVRVLALLLASYPERSSDALRACGVPVVGTFCHDSVRCEQSRKDHRDDLFVAVSDPPQKVGIEAKVDSALDIGQLKDLRDAHGDAVLAALVADPGAPDVGRARRVLTDLDIHVVRWADLLAAMSEPVATKLAADIDGIVCQPSSKTRQRQALGSALSAISAPDWLGVDLEDGESGWPSLVIRSDDGQIVGQVECAHRQVGAALRFKAAIGFSAGWEPRLSRLNARLGDPPLPHFFISLRRGDSKGRAKQYGVPDWLARGYGGSYLGVRTNSRDDAGTALSDALVLAEQLGVVIASE